MAKSLMICANASNALKLNEAAGQGKKYILEGVFAELDTLNRNQRIYPKAEYLKHLQYLRDDIKKGEPLLGELDHPDDRFEVKLKEASHRIIDLWYDEATNRVMGKIELLNTPNGKLAQSIVDQGIPLHISSRAAGTVNGDNTVSIQQIYTYDLVCKPGFAGAVLHRVNESVESNKYSVDVNKFLGEANRMESMNAAPQYGILNENFAVIDVNAEANLRSEAKTIQYNMKNVNEMTDELSLKSAMLREEDEAKEGSEQDGASEKDDAASDENAGVEILEIEALGDDDEIIDIKGVTDDEESDEESEEGESEEGEDNKDENPESEESSEGVVRRSTENNNKTPDASKDMLLDCTDSDIASRKKKLSDIDERIAALKKKKSSAKECVKESLAVAEYPVAGCLNESNLATFASLSESQKQNVVAYLRDSKITSAESINENWVNGINYTAAEPVWLKLAPAYYRGLFESASDSVKESINYTAKFLMFENQNDINTFWQNTGLAARSERELANEQFMNIMPKISNVEENTDLPYGKDFINMVADMACEYGR